MDQQKKGKIHYAWFVMIAGCFMQGGCLGILFNGAGVFLQPVADAIGCGRGDLAFYMTLMAFVTAATMPLVGKWLPTKNINVLLSVMAIICAGGYALMSTYTQVWQWYISSVIMGFSSAFLWFAPVPMIIRNWFKKSQGLALGIATTFSGLAAAIVNPVASNLIRTIGWQKSYVVMAVLSVVLTVPFTAFVIKFKPADKGLKPYGEEDGVSVAASAARMNQGVSVGRAAKSGLLVLIILIAGFVSLAASFSQHMSGFGASVGLTPTLIGLVASCSMIGNMAGKLILGGVNDKFGLKVSFIFGYSLVVAACLIMLFSGGRAPMLMVGSLLYGFAMSMGTILIPLVCGAMFGNKDFPKLFSYATMGNSLIGSMGITLCGLLFDWTGTYLAAVAFVMICAVLVVPMILLGLARAKKVGFDTEKQNSTTV